CFLLFRVEHYFAHSFFHAIRKFAYGGAWWRAVRIEIDPWNINSFGEVQECGAAKAGLVRIVQTGWNDLHLESAGRSRRQCDARGAGLQRLQSRLVVRDTFRTNADRDAAGEKFARGGESFNVARNVFAFILSSISGR